MQLFSTFLRLGVHRKQRFSEQFNNDIADVVKEITVDIFVNLKGGQRGSTGSREAQENLNASLAFFLHDLLSVMDRGFVFTLISSYLNQPTNDSSLQIDFMRILCRSGH